MEVGELMLIFRSDTGLTKIICCEDVPNEDMDAVITTIDGYIVEG
jgi:hypothetical protein